MISFQKFWQKMAETQTVSVIENGVPVDKKLTESLLCKITGLSSQTTDAMKPVEKGKVYKRERGNVSLDVINRLCDFFDCQPCDLIEYKE